MTATLDQVAADPQQPIAELLRQLDERTAERDAALAREAAVAEVLGVINSSRGDLTPVFDAMLDKAVRLCEANFGVLWRFDGEVLSPGALHQVPAAFGDFIREPRRPTPDSGPGRIMRGEGTVAVPDLMEYPPYRAGDPMVRAIVDLGGARSVMITPLRRDGITLGGITIYRQEVRPFTEKQIALLENFAAQAVIAMENARLITETREALEQQQAVAEVLHVINRSLGELQPVFDILLDKAMELCGAAFGLMRVVDGELFRTIAAHGVPADFAEFTRHNPLPPEHGGIGSRLRSGEAIVHTVDLKDGDLYRNDDPQRRALVDLGGARTSLTVALRRDGELLGAIQIYRQEVRPFGDKQIALLQNFAAQAVIAMENARLIIETREALDQQTATAEVLGVINSSPGDLAPVFDAILEKAHSLCGAAKGSLVTYDGDAFRAVATRGLSEEYAALLRASQHDSPGSPPQRLLDGESLVQIADMRALPSPVPQAAAEREGARTVLYVPLRKDSELLGYITAYRQEVRPFTDKQIALLQNFAAQAVIAMENARLITETREALEQQTATAEVLQVINSSPGDLAPVFDAILEKAHGLCGIEYGTLQLYDGVKFRAVSTRGFPELMKELVRQPYALETDNPRRVVLEQKAPFEIPNVPETDAEASNPRSRAATALGIRSILFIPLVKEDQLLGLISAARTVTGRFTEKQIALLQNFAAQAVIAMENARLITETREALEQQTATAEVLGVINSSPGDLAPVFDEMLNKATRLCEAAFGILLTYDRERFQHAALRGIPAAYSDFMHEHPPVYGPESAPGRLRLGEGLVHVIDMTDTDLYRSGELNRRAIADLAGARTVVAVALRKDDVLLGAIIVFRQEVRPFSDKQIALLQNFAAQAVIAMESARLLGEIRQREQELRVTFDNMVDGVAMFDEALQLAAWNRNFQELLQLSDEFLAEPHGFDAYIRHLTERGEFGEIDPETQIRCLRERIGDQYSFERTRPDGKVIEVRNNPMPNGGTVVIYSDITERRRSEEEIRAARDAAEAALRDLRAAQSSLIQAQKMAALGQLTAGIAHEIKNPLNFVNNFAGLSVELLDELKETAAPAIGALDDDKRAEIDETIGMLTSNLEKISEHGRRADNIVKSMLEHSRGVSGERREVDLNNLIDEALNLAYHGARAQDGSFNIGLEHDYAPMLKPIELVPQEITRVFLNLFSNGFYAAHKRAQQMGDASFQPLLTVATRELDEAVEVRIRDNGIGIPHEFRDKLFQPFFTTKPTGEGTGLGLSISYDIVTQQHGGTIGVESQPGEFTEFIMRLPRQ